MPQFPLNAQYPRFLERSSTEKKCSFHPRADDRGQGIGYFIAHSTSGQQPQNPKGHSMTMTSTANATPSRGWHIGLWAAQIALAGLYLMGAWFHFLPAEEAAKMGAVWMSEVPIALPRFIGVMEVLGVIGLILPAATRIMPHLTVWAAAGLLAIQALAIPFHAIRGEFEPLPFNLIYVALAVLVLWGRARKAPIAPRA
jgi:putative oxidoreductase